MSIKKLVFAAATGLCLSFSSFAAQTWVNKAVPTFTTFNVMMGTKEMYGGTNGYVWISLPGDPNKYMYSLDLGDAGQRAIWATLLAARTNGWKFDVLFDGLSGGYARVVDIAIAQ